MSRSKPRLVRPEQKVSAVQGYLPEQAALTGCEYHERLLFLGGHGTVLDGGPDLISELVWGWVMCACEQETGRLWTPEN